MHSREVQKQMSQVFLYRVMRQTKPTVKQLRQQGQVAWQPWMQSGTWQVYIDEKNPNVLSISSIEVLT
jgi:hypothetical protein